MVKTASLYDNVYVIYDVIIWVQDGNCKKWLKKWLENFSIGAFYNITKNQDNPIKTVGRDSFFQPKKTLKYKYFRGHPAPRGRTALYSRGHN